MNTGTVDAADLASGYSVTTRVSVIVPAFNEEQGLAASLRSIRQAMERLDAGGWRSELIVCDNNSTDRTADIARAAGARVVFEPINQIARARNAGAAVALGDWLVFIDADSHPNEDLFVALLRVLQSCRAIAGGSTLCFDTPDLSMAIMAKVWNAVSRCTRWAAGSFIYCEAAAFREAGGFCHELYATEDIDLFRRLKQLARRRGRTIEILRDHPLRTSARKVRLYTWQEAVRFVGRTLIRRGRTLRSAEECFSWYDGRR